MEIKIIHKYILCGGFTLLLALTVVLLFFKHEKEELSKVFLHKEAFEAKETQIHSLSSETERPPDLDGVFAQDKIAEFDIKIVLCGSQQIYFLSETNLPTFFKLGYTKTFNSKMRLYIPNFVEDLPTTKKD